jgi:hypothetical protein
MAHPLTREVKKEVHRAGGHSVPGLRREVRCAGFDDRVDALGRALSSRSFRVRECLGRLRGGGGGLR